MKNSKLELIDLINTLTTLAYREHDIDRDELFSCPLSKDPYLPHVVKKRKSCECGANIHNKKVKEVQDILIRRIQEI